jgi:coenzyme F420-dependent glucose-6-phosphate dehydrogenase
VELWHGTRGPPTTLIGYHASHEQFAPSELLQLVIATKQAGFDCAKSSDHFHPWSEKSRLVRSWLGAAMQARRLGFGIISAPRYRYHAVVLAQAAATIGEIFQAGAGCHWGAARRSTRPLPDCPGPKWPSAMRGCASVDIVRALLAGETVSHRGRVAVVEAKLLSPDHAYSTVRRSPKQLPPSAAHGARPIGVA